MSTAWYKPGVAPKLLRSFPSLSVVAESPSTTSSSASATNYEHRIIEVWNTTCIVSNFGKLTNVGRCSDDKSNNEHSDTTTGSRPGHEHTCRRRPGCKVLINPGNEQLSGVSRFPYFPKGGPVPKSPPDKDAHHIMGYVSQWGGMEVGSGMLFPANAVDGLVHQLGGHQLKKDLRDQFDDKNIDDRYFPFERFKSWLSLLSSSKTKKINNKINNHNRGDGDGSDDGLIIRCPIGSAIGSGSGIGSDLSKHYDRIVHTVPPFYHHHHENNPEKYLSLCYENSLSMAFVTSSSSAFVPPSTMDSSNNKMNKVTSNGIKIEDSDRIVRVACPLLGAGTRGTPLDIAVRIAAKESVRWCNEVNHYHQSNLNQYSSSSPNDKKMKRGTTKVLAFGIPDPEIVEMLVDAIEEERGGRGME